MMGYVYSAVELYLVDDGTTYSVQWSCTCNELCIEYSGAVPVAGRAMYSVQWSCICSWSSHVFSTVELYLYLVERIQYSAAVPESGRATYSVQWSCTCIWSSHVFGTVQLYL
jgi:hypothetical protein